MLEFNFRVVRRITNLILWVGLLLPVLVDAQITSQLMVSSMDSIPEDVILPQFRGGEARMFKLLEAHVVYPPEAKKDGVTGTVVVQFTVDTTGVATDISIVQGVRFDINREAARVVGLLKDWTPATQNGRKVSISYTLPIRFSLSLPEYRKPRQTSNDLAPFLKWKR